MELVGSRIAGTSIPAFKRVIESTPSTEDPPLQVTIRILLYFGSQLEQNLNNTEVSINSSNDTIGIAFV
ncbi:unnamed protein product, partial [marine sediment metagenome]